MKKRNRVVITVLLLCIVGVGTCAAVFAFHNRDGFTGNRVKNPDEYILNIEKMNGTDSHTMELCVGDFLKIEFKTEKGKLNTEIKSPSGNVVYSGNGKGLTEFTVNAEENGKYSFTVNAEHAKGTVHIKAVSDNSQKEGEQL